MSKMIKIVMFFFVQLCYIGTKGTILNAKTRLSWEMSLYEVFINIITSKLAQEWTKCLQRVKKVVEQS